MSKFSDIIIRYRKTVISIFFLLALSGVLLSGLVDVNFKLADYLPKDADSTKSLNIMGDEFGSSFPNARVMINNVSVMEALQYKEKLSEIDGISSVSWLDDIVGAETLSSTPLEYLDTSVVENYYKNNSALIYITVDSGVEEAPSTLFTAL